MPTFFTSDNHFFHQNILKYCDRPFKSLQEMNEEMVLRWNSVVKPEDTIYHLGDFSMGSKAHISHTLSMLNGYKILIKGNHDRSIKAMIECGFNEAYNSHTLDIDNTRVFMSHKPLPLDQLVDANICLCGHVHGAWKFRCGTINVGVDQWDFTPRTLDELRICLTYY